MEPTPRRMNLPPGAAHTLSGRGRTPGRATVGAGSDPLDFTELAAEIIAVAKTAAQRDFRNGSIRLRQQLFGAGDAELLQVFRRRAAGHAAEVAAETAARHPRRARHLVERDRL